MIQMTKEVYSSSHKFSNELAQSIILLRLPEAADTSVQEEMLLAHWTCLVKSKALKQLKNLLKCRNNCKEDLKPLEYNKNNIKDKNYPCFSKIGHSCYGRLKKVNRSIELILPKDLWPVPTYGDMLLRCEVNWGHPQPYFTNTFQFLQYKECDNLFRDNDY